MFKNWLSSTILSVAVTATGRLLFGLLDQFVFKLGLLLFGEHSEFANDFLVALEATVTDDVAGFPVSLGLGHLVVLGAHVHVSGCVGGVLLAAVVQTRELLLQVAGAPPNVLFPLDWLTFTLQQLLIAHVVDQGIVAILFFGICVFHQGVVFLADTAAVGFLLQ